MLSPVQLFATPQTVTCQGLCPWNYPIKNIGMIFHFLLQGIFPTQGSNCTFPVLMDRCFTTEPPGNPSKFKTKVVIKKSLFIYRYKHMGFPGGASGKEPACHKELRFDP